MVVNSIPVLQWNSLKYFGLIRKSRMVSQGWVNLEELLWNILLHEQQNPWIKSLIQNYEVAKYSRNLKRLRNRWNILIVTTQMRTSVWINQCIMPKLSFISEWFSLNLDIIFNLFRNLSILCSLLKRVWKTENFYYFK